MFNSCKLGFLKKAKRRFDEVGGSFEEKRCLAWCHVIKFVFGMVRRA